ncbi:phospholipid carrier-dependent glycosyltransferase [Algoriphagus kandeliae]|uniref:Phospholipid carrier-dependent glycosyltransferase n=1 Tax=Algoriphagus kandeliae TaxID=2562278 RepID=A0A4Y9QQZ6_9BACT|nr:glycosyltransferase family 39 protein [Algoriphagus kandeliae]TFV93466.1 phospholipid carrier-dependent glycosyltransferase [Algoriphagus kandeliae]
MKIFKNYILLFWLVQGLLIALKIAFTLRPEINLFTEEAQYWLWSQNLAWHYYSKPPLIAVFNFISTSILGVNELAVRINAALLGIGTAWLVFYLTDFLFHSKRIAFWASLILSSMPFFILFSTFHMTDSELTFFWILTWVLVAKALKEEKLKWWVFAGIAALLGMASKPIMVLVLPSLGLFLFLAGRIKNYGKEFLLFAVISLIGLLPSLVWNSENGFQTFRHLATLGGVNGSVPGRDLGEMLLSFLEFLGGQLLIASLFLLPLWILFACKVRKFDSKQLFLILPAAVSFLTFAFISLFTVVQVNWPAFSYPTLAIVLAYVVEKDSVIWSKIRTWGIGLGIFLSVLLMIPEINGWKKLVGLEKLEIAVFKRLTGYNQLADRVAFLEDSLGIQDSFYFSESYHVSSELAFYLPAHPQTFQIARGGRRNQFDLWESVGFHAGLEETGVFVSFHEDSPGTVTTFQELIYEEDFPVYFRDEYLRSAKIQFWRNLQKYEPINSDAY